MLNMVVQLLIIIIAVVVLGWWFQRSQRHQHHQEQMQRERVQRAQTIMAQGGPQTHADYIALFPDACPRCGGRSRMEGIGLRPEPTVAAPLTNIVQPARPAWLCVRCGYGTALTLAESPTPILRQVPSPYLAPAVADRIAEPPYPPASTPSAPVRTATAEAVAHLAPATPVEVVLLNDEQTPMEFVIHMLHQLFDQSLEHAHDQVLLAHQHQQHVIVTLPKAHAERLITEAHAVAQVANYPLTFRLQPVIQADSVHPDDG